MSKRRPAYPDISDLLSTKAAGRRARAKRSLGQKIDALEAMRLRVEPIRRARIARGKSPRSAAQA